MAMKNHRKLIKDISLLLLGLFIAIGLTFPVSAQSSLSGIAECAKSPSCASQLGIQTAVKNGSVANNIVPFTLKARTSQGLVERTINTLGIVGLTKLIGIDGDSLLYGGVNESGIQKIRDAAVENLSGSGSYFGEPGLYYSVWSKRPGLRDWRREQSALAPIGNERYEGDYLVFDTGIGTPTPGIGQIYNVNNDAIIGVYGQFDSPYDGDEPIPRGQQNPEEQWNNSSDAQKEASLNEVLPNVNLDSSDVEVSSTPLPPDWQELELEPLTDLVTNQPDNPIAPAGTPFTIPRDTDNDGLSDSEDPDIDNDGIPNEEDPDIDNDGIANEDDCSTNPTLPFCDIDLDIVPDVDLDLQADQFQRKDWWSHLIATFSNRFPFDIMGQAPNVGDINQCPTYSFYGRSYELCPISDLYSVARYPIGISLLIKFLLSL